MAVKWTDEQLSAVNADVSNILVTAAAGAGKTQVLSGRIVKRIIDGADISRILVMTFTDAAAAEMRERITHSLSDYLRLHPENRHVRKQISFLPAASISTIHSFCLSVVRSDFFKTGLKASFRVGDDSEVRLLQLDAASQALEELYAEADADFMYFADCFASSRDDSNLIDLMLEVYEFAQSSPYPDKWLDSALDVYRTATADEFEQSEYCREILSSFREILLTSRTKLEDALTLARDSESWCALLKSDMEEFGIRGFEILDISEKDKAISHVHNVINPDAEQSKKVNEAMVRFVLNVIKGRP